MLFNQFESAPALHNYFNILPSCIDCFTQNIAVHKHNLAEG